MRNALLISVLFAASCEFPQVPSGLPCDNGDVCAAGQVCLDNLCVPEPPVCADAVSAGADHTCAIRRDHTAWCWGRNTSGQLGDGSTEDRTSPVRVAGNTRFSAIAPGTRHTCAIADDKERSVWCWGSNDAAQSGGATDGATPARLEGVSAAQRIVSGTAHSCALVDGGLVKCWGARDAGQLGSKNNGLVVDVSTATGVLQGVTDIAVGQNTSCAIIGTAAGGSRALWCWGDSKGGQVAGFGKQELAVAVTIPGDVARVVVGEGFVCALISSGDVYCRGDNSFGQLGVRGTPAQVPSKVPLPVRADSLFAGARVACVTERDAGEDPRMWCWGENAESQLAGANEGNPTPVVVRHANVVAATAGRGHLCVLSATGGILCSGYNSHGQLGDGGRTTRDRPPPAIAGLAGVVSIAAGERHSCAVVGDNVLCWGDNEFGQLGDGSTIARATPTLVKGVGRARDVVAGVQHSCARLADNTAMCWGGNVRGQVGNTRSDQRRTYPAPVMEPTPGGAMTIGGIAQIAAGSFHTCALLEGGAVKCWGDNSFKQVGAATTGCDYGCTTPYTPVSEHAREIALGSEHSCALLDDGTVACWGDNAYGQLGTGDRLQSAAPQVVRTAGGALTGVVHIATGDRFTCAVMDDGRVLCWGVGDRGELGAVVADRTLAGPAVAGATEAMDIAAGGNHACAIAPTGLHCWGSAQHGQTGNATYALSTPAAAIPLARGVRDLAGGDEHTCALLDNGTVTCWGDGRAGQLGTGDLDRRAIVAPRLPCP